MTLIKTIFSYSAANIINAAVPFFLLPILTAYLNPEEFGVLSLVQLLFTLSLPFVLMNIHGLFMIEYSKLSFDEFKSFVSSMILIPFFAFIIIQFLFFIFSNNLSILFNIPEKWVILSPIVVLAQSIPTMIPVLFQAKKQPINYGIFKITLTVVNLGLSLFLIVTLSQGLDGRLYGIFYSYILFTVVGFFILFKLDLLSLSVSFTHIKNALKFGIPLVPHTLAGIFLSMSDRIFLSNMLGNESVGIYSVAFQLSSAILIIMTSINQAWIPHLYEKLNSNPTIEEKRKIVIQSYKIIGIMAIITVIFIVTISIIYQIFIDERYYDGINISRLLAIGFMFQGFYFMVTNYIFYMKRSSLLSMITISSAIVIMSLNYILIPIYGVYGSTYAMVIGYFIWFSLTFYFSSKVYRMPWLDSIIKK
ncbi:lipopolysaccharide biosynthesis protein [Aliarcobacter butzleri]|uniref:lipopolysaccharide biosynthesis protein n=1 Tax=Aliarcobacter butzleri TaxID=28197 RepID=UPI003AF384B1